MVIDISPRNLREASGFALTGSARGAWLSVGMEVWPRAPGAHWQRRITASCRSICSETTFSSPGRDRDARPLPQRPMATPPAPSPSQDFVLSARMLSSVSGLWFWPHSRASPSSVFRVPYSARTQPWPLACRARAPAWWALCWPCHWGGPSAFTFLPLPSLVSEAPVCQIFPLQ